METPDFQNLLNQFNEKALRPALAAGKEKLDQTLSALTPGFIIQSLEDAYAQMPKMDLASGLAALDAGTIEQSVEALKAQLQKPAVSFAVAQGLKELLDKNSSASLETTVSNLAANASPVQQMFIQLALIQVTPKLDDLRNASVEDIAAQIRTGADNLSGADFAAQLTFVLKNAPTLLSGQTPDLTSKLPAPRVVADAVQEVGKAASDALGNASRGATLAETVSALKQFAANANSAVTRILGQDNAPPTQKPAVNKPKPPKKRRGGGTSWEL